MQTKIYRSLAYLDSAPAFLLRRRCNEWRLKCVRQLIHVHSSEEAFSINYFVEGDISAFKDKKKMDKERKKKGKKWIRCRDVHTMREKFLRYWQTRTHCCGHIVVSMLLHVAQTGKHLLGTRNLSDQNQKHFLCPGHKICVRNKCCARGQTGKHLCPQQCVRNNVSSFASTFRTQLCFYG